MNPLQDAFISYGRADSKNFAKQLNDRLVHAGFMVWFDFDDIPLGVDYQKQIDDGIEKADNFIFIISPHSINSPYCGLEVKLALEFGKRIIPLLHVEQISRETWQTRNPQGTDQQWAEYTAAGKHDHFANMHPTLRKINWIYCRENQDDVEKGLADLQELMQFQKDYVHQHTQLLVAALEWDRNYRQTEFLLVGDQCREGLAWLKTRFVDCQSPCQLIDLQSEYITESLKNANNLMTQVFLSYADKDREMMFKIRRSLWREGITVWTNTTDVQTGEDFKEAIHQGILRADNIVYLLSPASLASSYCQDELSYGFAVNKRIIPILVRPIDSDRLSDKLKNLHYIDLTDNEREEDYLLDEGQLLRILSTDQSYHQTHKILLCQAMKWEDQHRNPTILLRGYNLRQAETWLKTAKTRSQYSPSALQIEFIEESLRQPAAESLDVFISYSRSDSDFARNLNDNLQIYGKLTWFDQESIANASANFQEEIHQGIRVSNNFLFVLSPRSVTSPYCADEVEYAASLNKRIITILLHPINVADLHPELAKVQWIDFTNSAEDSNGDFWDDFNQLIRALDTDREYLQNHTRWSQRSIEWHHKSQSKDLLLRGSELILAQEWLTTAIDQKKQPSPTKLQHTFIEESDRQAQNELKKEKRQKIILRSLVGVMTSVAIAAIGATIWALKLQRESTINEIKALSISSNAQFKSSQSLDALITALKAARRLDNFGGMSSKESGELKDQVVSALNQAMSLGKEINRLEGFDTRVQKLKFSPDGKLLVIVDANNIQLLNFENHQRKIIAKLQKDSNSISIDFIPKSQEDFEILVIADHNSGARIFRYNFQGKLLPTLSYNPDWKKLAILDKVHTIITSDDNSIDLWQPDGTSIVKLPESSDIGYGLYWSEDGNIIIGYHDELKKFVVWKRDGSIWRRKILPLPDEANVRSITPNHQLIIDSDRQLYLYDLEGNKLLNFSQSNYNADAWVQQIKFSSDQKTIAAVYHNASSAKPIVRLWSFEGKLLSTLQGHESWIIDLRFSPDGQYIATGSADKTIKLWDLKGNLLSTFFGHGDYVNTISFVPDSQTQMIVSGSDDSTVRFWDLESTQNQRIDEKNIIFNNEQTKFVSFTEGRNINLWNINGTLIKSLVKNPEGKAEILWSNNGQTLITREYQDNQFYGPVKVWDADGNLRATLLEKKTTTSKEARTVNIQLSSDGQWIITTLESATDYGPVQLWSVDGKLQKNLISKIDRLEKNPVSGSVQFNYFDPTTNQPENLGKTENVIVTVLNDLKSYGPVQIWTTDGDLLATLQPKISLPSNAEDDDFITGIPILSENGSTIVSTVYSQHSYGPVMVWSRETGKTYPLMKQILPQDQSTFENWQNPINVQLSSNGQTILTSTATSKTYGPVDLWNTQGKRLFQLIDPMPISEDNPVEGYSEISPDAKTIVTSVFDDQTATVKLWKNTGEPIATLLDRVSTTDSGQLTFSKDSQTLVTAIPGGPVQHWNINGSLISTLIPHINKIWNLFLSPDTNLLGISEKPTTLELWNIENRPKRLKRVQGQGYMIYSNFSENSNWLAVSNYDNQVWIWQRKEGTLATLGGHKKFASTLQFDPQYQQLLAVDQDGVTLHNLSQIAGLDQLRQQGCDRLNTYLQYNPDIVDKDPQIKQLCDDL